MEDGGTNAKSLDPHLNSEDGSKREDVEEKEESGVEGGLMNHLISTLSPTNIGKSNENESNGDDGERKRVDDGGVEGGFISKMVSNFFHQSEGEGVVENEEDKEEEEIKGGERIKRLKTENNGGIIHNIVSHLPAASIPDGAVPTADEATFLINSLVRD